MWQSQYYLIPNFVKICGTKVISLSGSSSGSTEEQEAQPSLPVVPPVYYQATAANQSNKRNAIFISIGLVVVIMAVIGILVIKKYPDTWTTLANKLRGYSTQSTDTIDTIVETFPQPPANSRGEVNTGIPLVNPPVVPAPVNPAVQPTTSVVSNESVLAASRNGNLSTLRNLLNQGGNANAKDGDGITALMYAAMNNHLEGVSVLVSKGADLNTQVDDGETALMVAAAHGNTEIVKALVKAGADCKVTDRDGWTALAYANNKNHRDVVNYLINSNNE